MKCPNCGSYDVVTLKRGSLWWYIRRAFFDTYNFIGNCILYVRGYEWRRWELDTGATRRANAEKTNNNKD